MLHTTKDTVIKADAINMARSFRHWAGSRKPHIYVRRPGSLYCDLSRITQLYQRGMCTDRDPVLFNRWCKSVAAQWENDMTLLNFVDLGNTLSFISTESQELFYDDIITNGVYFMKSLQTSLPPDVLARLNMALASLEQSLLAKDPMMPVHLKNSHQLLISYPESVALLDDSEIATLIGAVQVHTKIEVVKAAVPRTGKKKISADDL